MWRDKIEELTVKEKQILLDQFGKRVIEHVRDVSFKMAMDIAKGKSTNTIKGDQYSSHLKTFWDGNELVYVLLSETITDTIYNFLDVFEVYSDEMNLYVLYEDGEYVLSRISEKLGGEIAFQDEDWWI